jgi:hypothetical protein
MPATTQILIARSEGMCKLLDCEGGSRSNLAELRLSDGRAGSLMAVRAAGFAAAVLVDTIVIHSQQFAGSWPPDGISPEYRSAPQLGHRTCMTRKTKRFL